VLHIAAHGITHMVAEPAHVTEPHSSTGGAHANAPPPGMRKETRLMLEDGKGGGVLVDESMIIRLIQNSAPAVVFLNVCASDHLADAFLKAGAKHVVC
jgi:hypothetical protein